MGTAAWCRRDQARRHELRRRDLLPATDADLPAAWAAMPRTPRGTAPRRPYPSPVLDLVLGAMPGTVAELAARTGRSRDAVQRAVEELRRRGLAVASGRKLKLWRTA